MTNTIYLPVMSTKARCAAVAALLVIGVAATSPTHAADQAVSPAMQTLISDFVEMSIRLAAIDASGEPELVGTAVQDRSKSLMALAFHAPTNVTELAAKLSAITEFSEDTERWSIRIISEDAAQLAEVAK